VIERLFVDNFRTLVNFEVQFDAIALLLGGNGSGKSTVLDVVQALHRFVAGAGAVTELFPPGTLTRWQSLNEQAFEIDVRSSLGLYRYALRLEHAADRRRCRARVESLTLDGQPLFEFTDGKIQLYNDQHDPGPSMTFDWSRSGLSMVQSGVSNTKLTEFKRRLLGIVFLRPCPPVMDTDSKEEVEELDRLATNFPSWYRFIARLDISRQLKLFQSLKEAIDGFESLRIEGPADSTVTLRVAIRPKGAAEAVSFKFSELSDGERQLILLYAVLYGMADETRILFLDEPDNFLALSEIEPWLNSLIDAAGDTIGQAIVVSHHPELIDSLAREKGVWLGRDSGGPTRVEAGRVKDTEPLKPSEFVARGW